MWANQITACQHVQIAPVVPSLLGYTKRIHLWLSSCSTKYISDLPSLSFSLRLLLDIRLNGGDRRMALSCRHTFGFTAPSSGVLVLMILVVPMRSPPTTCIPQGICPSCLINRKRCRPSTKLGGSLYQGITGSTGLNPSRTSDSTALPDCFKILFYLPSLSAEC
jgi:hypothetical protein